MANTNSETQIEGTASNHCATKIKTSRTSNLNFSWTIEKYSVFSQINSAVLKSAEFSAVDDDLKWYLTHSMQCNLYNEIVSVDVSLYPVNDVLVTYVLVSGNAKISLIKPECEMKRCLEKVFSYNFKKKDEETCCFELDKIEEMEKWLYEDKLTIHCQVSYTRYTDIVTTSTSLVSTPIKISESDHSLDFEKILNDEYFSDVTISVGDKNYPGHKAILSARSPVFNSMFRNDMQENNKSRIVIADIDQKTFQEMMRYIYTGKVENIEESAFELLPFADKYDLKELRIMCENVLCQKLSTDNVARILILADMHHAEDLKARTLRFIKVNHSKCKDFKETEVWNVLTTSRPHLMNDLMKIFFDE
ncbi:speckle-type POZ protein-like [Planococcus citri]|uniref:speckle-type POZ protein-like n=1 Tax=Planococcus citri TaxID=170843 RepID=UPI0031F9FF15